MVKIVTKRKKNLWPKMSSYVQLPCYLSYLSIHNSLLDIDIFLRTFHMYSPMHWLPTCLRNIQISMYNSVIFYHEKIYYFFFRHFLNGEGLFSRLTSLKPRLLPPHHAILHCSTLAGCYFSSSLETLWTQHNKREFYCVQTCRGTLPTAK